MTFPSATALVILIIDFQLHGCGSGLRMVSVMPNLEGICESRSKNKRIYYSLYMIVEKVLVNLKWSARCSTGK